MYLAPCWTTTVRGCAVIPVLELTRASLVTQGGNEHIRDGRAQSLSEGKNMAINFHIIPAYPTPTSSANSARVFAIGIFRGTPGGPKGTRREWQLHKPEFDQAEHVSFHNISCRCKYFSSIYPLYPDVDFSGQLARCACGRDWCSEGHTGRE